jgi:hypothetical protein
MFALRTLAALPLPLLLAAPPQEPQTNVPATPAVTTAPSEAKAPASERNVRVDVTVTVKGGDKVVAKSLSLVAADGRLVQGRAGVQLPIVMSPPSPNIPPSINYRDVGINVDASPKILASGTIAVSMKLNFSNVLQVPSGGGERPSFGSGSHETNAIVFDSGKPLVVLEGGDPESGRTYTVQVTATILK